MSGAVLNALADFFGRDKVEFDIVSGSARRRPDPEAALRALLGRAAGEVVEARIWGGIHFRTADEQGAKMGKQIAQWIKTRYFEPVR